MAFLWSRVPIAAKTFVVCTLAAIILSSLGSVLFCRAASDDNKGRAESVVGVDMSLAKEVVAAQAGLEHTQETNFLVCTILSVALGILAARRVANIRRTLGQHAERMRSGGPDSQIDASRADEIGRFAETFKETATGLRQSRERLKECTSVDFMTGLANYVYFHERLEYEIERAALQGSELCVLLIDIDKFRLLNDAFGRDVGDGLVQQVAAVLSSNVRKKDVVVRYGGDDFGVILLDTGLAEGRDIAERLRAKIARHAFLSLPADRLPIRAFRTEEEPIHLTITVGVAAYPTHHSTKDGIVMAADVALCQAQRATRNAVWVFDPRSWMNRGVDPGKLFQVLRDPTPAALRLLAAAVDARDPYTNGHSERVSEYAHMLAELVGYEPAMADEVRTAGLIHDLGKLGIPDSILCKPAALTPEEEAIVRSHPTLGESVLRCVRLLEQVIPAVLHHHERWDGGGYPDGLSGEDIPLLARIAGIADAFDAMTTDRPYRPALSFDKAFSELRAGAGRQFDPSLVEPFIEAVSAHKLRRAA